MLGGHEDDVERKWRLLDGMFWMHGCDLFESLPAVVLSFRGRWKLLAFRALRLMFSDTF